MYGYDLKNFDVISGVTFERQVAGSYVRSRDPSPCMFLVITSEVEDVAKETECFSKHKRIENIGKFALINPRALEQDGPIPLRIVRMSRLKHGFSIADIIDTLTHQKSYEEFVEPLGKIAFVENINKMSKDRIFEGNSKDILIEKWSCRRRDFSFSKMEGNLKEYLQWYANGGFPLRLDPKVPNRIF
jgi:hypothetical protein